MLQGKACPPPVDQEASTCMCACLTWEWHVLWPSASFLCVCVGCGVSRVKKAHKWILDKGLLCQVYIYYMRVSSSLWIHVILRTFVEVLVWRSGWGFWTASEKRAVCYTHHLVMYSLSPSSISLSLAPSLSLFSLLSLFYSSPYRSLSLRKLFCTCVLCWNFIHVLHTHVLVRTHVHYNYCYLHRSRSCMHVYMYMYIYTLIRHVRTHAR